MPSHLKYFQRSLQLGELWKYLWSKETLLGSHGRHLTIRPSWSQLGNDGGSCGGWSISSTDRQTGAGKQTGPDIARQAPPYHNIVRDDIAEQNRAHTRVAQVVVSWLAANEDQKNLWGPWDLQWMRTFVAKWDMSRIGAFWYCFDSDLTQTNAIWLRLYSDIWSKKWWLEPQ